MSSFAAGLDLLVKRLETYSPAYDSQITFRLAEDSSTAEADRMFTIEAPLTLTDLMTTQRDPVQVSFELHVHYREHGESFELLEYVSRDMEDLIKRIDYVSGVEWAAPAYQWEVLTVKVDPEDNGYRLILGLRTTYNMRS